MVRVWNFLLPDSGEHTLRVEDIGKPSQLAFLDGAELESKPGQSHYAGPDGALLRLKYTTELRTPRIGATELELGWMLFVNERLVESVAANGDGLRDLRSMPEGSYTIAPSFDAEGLEQDACRKFRFLANGELHEVMVAHKEAVWRVALDGALVSQDSHSLSANKGCAEFAVAAAGGAQIPAKLEMAYSNMGMKWSYSLCVGSTQVPAAWAKTRGSFAEVVPPEVVAASAPTESMPSPQEADCEEQAGTTESASHALPQGVSYDHEARAYQANIKDPKTNRFVFLGEFQTPEAAHAKYMEMLGRYAPDKKLAPSLAA